MNSYDICTYDNLLKGCIISSIAHAIMMKQYPELSYEQSWDDKNFSIQNGEGIRATISFSNNYCVAAIRDDNSKFIHIKDYYIKMFESAPDPIFSLAKDETLQYLFDEVEGKVIPVISTAFWCDMKGLYSNSTYDEMMLNGFEIISALIMNYDTALEFWRNYYDMSENDVLLLRQIYEIKINKIFIETIISKEQISGFVMDLNENECKVSFEEMKIYFKI